MKKELEAIKRLRPNCTFSLVGDDVQDIKWAVPADTTTPTAEEIQAEIAKMDAEPAQLEAAKAAAQAKLAALGLTTDDLKALGL